jgi:hypothetical protein
MSIEGAGRAQMHRGRNSVFEARHRSWQRDAKDANCEGLRLDDIDGEFHVLADAAAQAEVTEVPLLAGALTKPGSGHSYILV